MTSTEKLERPTVVLLIALAAAGCGRQQEPCPPGEPSIPPTARITPGNPQAPAVPDPAPARVEPSSVPDSSTKSATFDNAVAEVLRLEDDARFAEALAAASDLLRRYTEDEQRDTLRRLEYRVKTEKRNAAGIPRMLEQLASDDKQIVDLARQRIERAGSAGVIHLRKAVRESSPEIAAASALILLDLRDDDALEPMVERLRSTHDEQLVAVLTDVLKQLRVPDVQARLLKAVEETPDPAKAQLFGDIHAHIRARNNRYLDLSAELNGRVSDNAGWQPMYTNVTLEAFPLEGYRFLQWVGDVPTNDVQANPLVVEMDRARTVSARFVRSGGQYRIWNAAEGAWHVAEAWTPEGVPGPLDTVRITRGTIKAAQAITIDSLVARNARIEVQGWDTVQKVANEVVLGDGAVLTHSRNAKEPAHRLHLSCRALSLSTGAVITATAAGYVGEIGNGNGPGSGASNRAHGAGGGNGGRGGSSSGSYARGGTDYGDVAQPTQPGSAGGGNGSHASGGNGGGMIVLEATAGLELNGRIEANGSRPTGHHSHTPAAGGGSGGSIVIRSPRLAGSGTLRADGGNGGSRGGGGGGGRVALHVADASTFRGTVSADRGDGAHDGDIGTVYVTDPRLPGSAAFVQGGCEIHVKDSAWQADTLQLARYRLRLPRGTRASVTGRVDLRDGSALKLLETGSLVCNAFSIEGSTNALCRLQFGSNNRQTEGSRFECKNDFSASHSRIDQFPESRVTVGGRLALSDRSSWHPYCNPTSGVPPAAISVGELALDEGCAIDADSAGYVCDALNGRGPGAGANNRNCGSGGGHGGNGGNSVNSYAHGGKACDDIEQPVQPGSSGAAATVPHSSGGNGGGVIRLVAKGIARVDGRITAVGGPATGHPSHRINAGAGAGGTIHLACDVLEGRGTIRADGGQSDKSGGGGGGRIALLVKQPARFGGRLSANGGRGGRPGNPGTIYVSDGEILPVTWINDGGIIHAAGGTWDSLPSLTVSNAVLVVSTGTSVTVSGDIDIHGSATVTIGSTAGLRCGGSLTLNAGSFHLLSATRFQVAGALTLAEKSVFRATCDPETGVPPATIVVRDLAIEAGSALTASGRGFRGGALGKKGLGPGGGSPGQCGGGGGHGGAGGKGAGNAAPGQPYDSADDPQQCGSGGGGGGKYNGSSGGGYLRIKAAGTVTCNGSITADGAPNSGGFGGCGAGGGIVIACATLKGGAAGLISANGGGINGSNGGGGGGGRIAIRCKTRSFQGKIVADGGTAKGPGQPGTIR